MSTPTSPVQAFSAQAVNWANRTLVTSDKSNFVANAGKVTARAAVDTALIVAALVETVANAVLTVASLPVTLIKKGAFTHMKERTVSSATAMLDAGKGAIGFGPIKVATKGNTGPVEPKRREGILGYVDDGKKWADKAGVAAKAVLGSGYEHVKAHKYAYIGGAVALGAVVAADAVLGSNYSGRAAGAVANWTVVPAAQGAYKAGAWALGGALGAVKWTAAKATSPFSGKAADAGAAADTAAPATAGAAGVLATASFVS
jgi:uncharacterized membrane protein YvlD (DUF360 family)